MKKIVRTLCGFAARPDERSETRLHLLAERLTAAGYDVQTLRFCSPGLSPAELDAAVQDPAALLSLGSVPFADVEALLPAVCATDRVAFNTDLTGADIGPEHVALLFRLIAEKPAATFLFAYVFDHVSSSPYFPSACYEREGFSVGLQATDLAEGCGSLDEWLCRMETVWLELAAMFGSEPDFLGIDSSIAPLFEGDSSLLHLVRRLGYELRQAVTSDLFLRMTTFIKTRNPRPVGLCGLMLPCLEDFELAAEYDRGGFPLERNLFASLQCGLGIDTYPIGVDEDPERVAQVLRLVQGLALRYHKPLSVRLVSDGRARIGERTDFRNQYLKDVTVRPL
jgi:hypothetical protein